ncbi:MAG TPA: hypothetical protein PLP23_18780 [Panacibacter sp.]|nr:hypothetical protein [Panacibacter sp.]
MKKRSNQLFALTLCLGIFLTSCGAGEMNTKAEETATNFYTDLQKKDYTTALTLCSDKAFEADTKEAWIKSLQRNSILLGDVKTFTKTSGFNVETSTSTGTTVTVTYDVQWQYGKSQDSVILIKEKDGSMKVYRYAWLHKEPKYATEITESEKEATQYMDAVKSGNYDAAIALCSDEALKATPKENWAAFLNNAANKLGSISNYSVIKDSSTYNIGAKGESGEGNYYDIYIKSNRGNNEVMEKVVFFQKNYDEPIKLAGHYFL